MTETTPITQLLRQSAAGDVSANAQLLPLVYAELRALAAQRLRSERAGELNRHGPDPAGAAVDQEPLVALPVLVR